MSKAALTLSEQLGYLKAMTARTGAIHEAQAVQLRLYPRLLPGIKSSETNVDFEGKVVTYSAKGSALRKTAKNKKLLEHIALWTKMLLWDETTVVIKINDKVVFDTRNTDGK